MTRILFAMLLAVTSLGTFAQNDQNPDLIMPSFPGGIEGLGKFLIQTIKYPPLAEQYKVGGRILTEFVVYEDGSLHDIKVLERSIEYYTPATFSKQSEEKQQQIKLEIAQLLEDEAVRVVKAMPRWIPGELNGEYVGVRYAQPIHFSMPY